MAATTLQDFVKALQLSNKEAVIDSHAYGEVKAINEDRSYQVSLNGSTTTVRCARLSGAKVGDTVLVTILKNGYAVVTGTVGGDTDASDAQKAAEEAIEATGEAQRAAAQAAESAADAAEAASDAQSRADSAARSASDASDAATAAQTSAGQAATSASSAASQASAAAGSAAQAATAAGNAQTSAGQAATSAGEAAASAATAAQEAGEASRQAGEAKQSADIANIHANSAVAQLGTVMDVIGTLNWIASHGFYVASTDRTVNEQKTYYTLTASAIASPTGDPSSSGYYELVNGKYVLSTDTAVDGTKTYYQVTAATVTSPEGSPSENDYYELRIDEAITQYIATHLALTGEGLRVTDGSSSSMLISSSGVTIRGSSGQIVGQYGEGAIIGNELDYHIKIVNGRLSFMRARTEIAWMTGERLYIPSVVVIDSMQAGNWLWDAKSNTRHLTLKWNEEVS